MTTLASWAAVDSRGVASVYLVSDSRFTISGTGQVHTDAGQKIYVCSQEPHLYGFCGSVNFPAGAISLLVQDIDAGRLFSAKDDLDARQRKVIGFLDTGLRDALHTPAGRYVSAFTILHAARERVGLKSTFRLWVISWSPFESWQVSEVPMPQHSKLLYEDGSGATALRIEHDHWQRSDVSKTSRAIFSAFCDALHTGRDNYSGGAPQLGGLFRKFAGKYFGVIFGKRRYYQGQVITRQYIPTDTEWFNETFERADPSTAARLQNAQRQPRPWPSRRTTRYLP
jgi:hypothetical protein